ncbi:hypothetical protein BMQ_pBM30008 (plasmid) [Priestia megaterium QM B1551]|uniref:Uncharacterized protein n=1 Tax=Priestia megaterium (strain ATCC 12872 / QMB1551) TaxID=545693 RepID=D5E3A0_PRIM1|nr:hypothetical protein BMQ_pBM30008 [Priestia megaterium QM B1551]
MLYCILSSLLKLLNVIRIDNSPPACASHLKTKGKKRT